MKALFLVAALLISVGVVAQTQTRMTAEEKASIQTDQMDKLVTLTDDQKVKIQKINIDFAEQLDTFAKERKGRDALIEKMKILDAERDKQYKAVLTKEQYKKYNDEKAARMKLAEERSTQQPQ